MEKVWSNGLLSPWVVLVTELEPIEQGNDGDEFCRIKTWNGRLYRILHNEMTACLAVQDVQSKRCNTQLCQIWRSSYVKVSARDRVCFASECYCNREMHDL